MPFSVLSMSGCLDVFQVLNPKQESTIQVLQPRLKDPSWTRATTLLDLITILVGKTPKKSKMSPRLTMKFNSLIWKASRIKFCWKYFPYWILEESFNVAKFQTDSVIYRMTNHYGKGWVVIVFCVARKHAPRTFRFQCAPSFYNGRTSQPHADLFGSKLNFEIKFWN